MCTVAIDWADMSSGSDSCHSVRSYVLLLQCQAQHNYKNSEKAVLNMIALSILGLFSITLNILAPLEI